MVPLLEVADQVHTWEVETIEQATRLRTVPDLDDRIITWLPLCVDRGLRYTSGKTCRREKADPPSCETTILAFHQKSRTRQVALLTRQLELERKLASLVEDVYGLTSEERLLLRSTRPVRDPLDVLEAKIRGGHQEDVHTGD